MIEKYAVAKEDQVEVIAEELIKTGEAKTIEEAREKALDKEGDNK